MAQVMEKVEMVVDPLCPMGAGDGVLQQDNFVGADATSDSDLNEGPKPPRTLAETGLSGAFVSDLVAKHLYRFGVLGGREIAAKICLPFAILDPILDELVGRAYAEKRGGKGLGNSEDRFSLTELGRNYTREILNLDTYIGPAPVPLEQYTEYVRRVSVRQIPVTEDRLRTAWKNLVLEDRLFGLLGPAIQSGKSCFLYGCPGVGKTTIAKAISEYLNRYGGQVAVPHAILVDGNVIRIYDEIWHKRVEAQPASGEGPQWLRKAEPDRRWVFCRRPAVVVGGELTLDMLDLRYNSVTRYYEAPLHLKANGGVFVIDDFGRQLVQPGALLNRWIIPLEERIDFLTLHTGKKFAIPFEELVIFATNLDPKELADEAFLRRIRYKILVAPLSAQTFRVLLEREFRKKGIVFQSLDLTALIQKFYLKENRPMRPSDARDLTDFLLDYIRYNGLPEDVPLGELQAPMATYFSQIHTITVS